MSLAHPEVIIATAAGVITIVTSVGGLGWFLRDKLSDLKGALETKLDDHEVQDQGRHEDNLRRFGQVNVALARLGIQDSGLSNGHTISVDRGSP